MFDSMVGAAQTVVPAAVGLLAVALLIATIGFVVSAVRGAMGSGD